MIVVTGELRFACESAGGFMWTSYYYRASWTVAAQFNRFKGPLQYLFRPLLGKKELDQIWTIFIEGKYGSVYDVIAPRPMSRDQKQKNAFLLQDLPFCP